MAGERVNRVTDHGCFGCGERNPIGLKLAFYREEEGVEASFTPQPEHEGYIGLVHGGILATLLDEAMSWAVISTAGRLMVTAHLSIAFRRPVAVGQQLRLRGWVERSERRLVRARAEIRDAVQGTLLAEAEGTFLPVAADREKSWREQYIRSATADSE
ncbi:PaaI family thioesterase [Thermomicrobium sp. 4228-Ro]|uniref:PaaI family thioesterase n=1 Tax=Thermomicrobium sp. 4228-Ro TaxID=2993937 RepID=UPI002248D0ED|nr:PaaI family thioesterase [Thermomicrobium sp. 4228-Ro]MCX2727418.1 PaaI family thioesterase [Thermomicrobium sp. 4228-Ro]